MRTPAPEALIQARLDTSLHDDVARDFDFLSLARTIIEDLETAGYSIVKDSALDGG